MKKSKIKAFNNDIVHEEKKPPETEGEESISGSATSPDKDDNVLDNAKEVGLYDDADEEHPSELGIGEEINKHERNRRGKS